MLTCPSCNAHHWPSNTFGLRGCPQCKATIALSKAGATVHVTAAESQARKIAQGHRARLESIGGVDFATRLKRMREHRDLVQAQIDNELDAALLAEADRTKNKRGLRIMPAHYNNAAQRIDAEIAALEIERARRNLLDSGCDAWSAETLAIEACAHGYADHGAVDIPHYQQTFRGYWLGPSVLSYLAAIQSGGKRGTTQSAKGGTLWRPEDFNDMARNLTTVGKALTVAIARARLNAPYKPSALNPVPVHTSRSLSALGPIRASVGRYTTTRPFPSGDDWLTGSKSQAQGFHCCSWRMPHTGKFLPRPLPRRAIPLAVCKE